MATIHTRMPAILRPDDELRWLDPTVPADELLVPIAAELLDAYPVGTLVNSWENEGPRLVEPAAEVTQITLPF
jgi:putative SOS response-associated peptidase YedK